MGAWSTDAFGNDDACDWAQGLSGHKDLSGVVKAIEAVLNSKGVDASAASEGLAAIEVLARLRGHAGFSNAYTAAADDWVARHPLPPSAELVTRALSAMDRITGEDSELRELWEEADEAAAWRASIDDLRRRLSAEPRSGQTAPDSTAPATSSPNGGGDEIDTLLQRIAAIDFSLPAVPANATVADLLKAVHAGGALAASEPTRYAISRIWQPVAQMGKENILWDLAVREAQTWAGQGQLPYALADLEAWRTSPVAAAPGDFDSRASGVCLSGGDVARARELRAKACDAKPEVALERIDRALLEARLGSAELAQGILDGEALDVLPEAFRLYITFIRGILACRRQDASALPLLTTAASGFVDKSQSGPASWSLLSICCTWWALALAQAGRKPQAAALVRSITPLLMRSHQRDVLQALSDLGVFDESALPQIAPARTATPAPAQPRDFKVLRVRGVNALQWVHLKRREFARGSRLYPFLIGDDKDYAELLDQLTPPSDGGLSALTAARELDAKQWIDQHAPKSAGRWPKDAVAAHKTPLSQFHTLSQLLKEELLIGLIELDEPSELFARLGYGGWNDCPDPHVHTALHRHWQQFHGAEPIALQGGVVECIVGRPPTEQAAALALAREHQGYCDDVIEQGVGSTAKHATSLLGANYWYFWWD